jgi:hypothetical protein
VLEEESNFQWKEEFLNLECTSILSTDRLDSFRNVEFEVGKVEQGADFEVGKEKENENSVVSSEPEILKMRPSLDCEKL